MGKALLDFGLQVGQSAIGAGMGMLLGKWNDRRQLEQERKLQALQIQGQKDMTDYNYMKQLQMWKDTNYSAQTEQLKKAGLNPGLLYGMSGGGGTTTGGGGGTVSRSNSPTGGGEAIAMAQTAAQLGLMRAQKENIEADTANKQADTANKPLTGEQIKSTTALNKLNGQILEYEKEIKGRSVEATVRSIDAAAEKLMHEAVILRNQENISEATWETEVKLKMAELITVGIQNNLTEQLTAESKQKVTHSITELLQKARALDQKDLEIAIQTFEANLRQEMPGIGQAIGRLVNGAINEYLHWTKGILGPKGSQKQLK